MNEAKQLEGNATLRVTRLDQAGSLEPKDTESWDKQG